MRISLPANGSIAAEKIEVRNPFDGSVVDTVPQATAADVEAAIAARSKGAAGHAAAARL